MEDELSFQTPVKNPWLSFDEIDQPSTAWKLRESAPIPAVEV